MVTLQKHKLFSSIHFQYELIYNPFMFRYFPELHINIEFTFDENLVHLNYPLNAVQIISNITKTDDDVSSTG